MNTLEWLHRIIAIWPWIVGAMLGIVCIGFVLSLAARLLQWRWLLSRKLVFMELTPPAIVGRSPEANQKLFAVIHGFRNIRPIKEKLLQRQTVIALEMDAARESGIRYIVQVDKRLAASLHQ